MHSYVESRSVYALTTYTANFFNPMVNMMDNLSFLQDGVVAGSRIFRFFDRKEYAPALQHPDAHVPSFSTEKSNFAMSVLPYDGEHDILPHDISFAGQTWRNLGVGRSYRFREKLDYQL